MYLQSHCGSVTHLRHFYCKSDGVGAGEKKSVKSNKSTLEGSDERHEYACHCADEGGHPFLREHGLAIGICALVLLVILIALIYVLFSKKRKHRFRGGGHRRSKSVGDASDVASEDMSQISSMKGGGVNVTATDAVDIRVVPHSVDSHDGTDVTLHPRKQVQFNTIPHMLADYLDDHDCKYFDIGSLSELSVDPDSKAVQEDIDTATAPVNAVTDVNDMNAELMRELPDLDIDAILHETS
ncbi:MAG: hypothetical protein MHM6MM_001253 [Cercozoa sp. M6MM]